jgi:hypothetical protein
MATLFDVESDLAGGMGGGMVGPELTNEERRRQRLLAAFEAVGRPEMAPVEPMAETPAMVAPDAAAARKMALEALAAPTASTPPADMELEALGELRAAQGRAQRTESLLPYMAATQRITEALTGAPVDVGTIQTIGRAARAKEADAAARLDAARAFARRAAEGENLRLRLTADAAQQQADAAARAKRDAFGQAVELEKLRQKEAELAIKAGRLGESKGMDPLTREKRLLEIEKLKAEIEATKSGRKTPTEQLRELQLAEAQKKASGELTPAERAKRKTEGMKVLERTKNIDRMLNKLSKIIEEKGTWQAIGAHNKEINDIIYNVAIEHAKLVDPDSVAREGEVVAAKKYGLFEATPFLLESTAQDIIKNFRENSKARLQNALEVRGLTTEDIQGEAKEKTASKPRFPIIVQDKASGRRFSVNNESELEQIKPMADRLLVVE